MHPSNQFLAVLADADLQPSDGVLEIGRLTRCRVITKNGKNLDGAYVYHERGDRGWGGYQNHTDGLGWRTWRSDEPMLRDGLVDPSERFLAKMLAQEREAEVRAIQAAHRAKNIYDLAKPLVKHPYIERKKLEEFKDIGLRVGEWSRGEQVWPNALLMPILDGGKWASLLAINEDGEKMLLYAGKKQGNFFYWGNLRTIKTIVIGEGLASVMSYASLCGNKRGEAAYVVAIDAGNIAPVCVRLRAINPKAHIIVAADNDEVGLEAAHAANRSVFVSIDRAIGSGDDWSDCWVRQSE